MLFYKFQITCELKIDKAGNDSPEAKHALKFRLNDLSAACTADDCTRMSGQ